MMIKDNKNYNEKVKPNTEFLKELKSKLPQFFINEKHDEEGNLISEGYFDTERFQESLRENNINEIKEGYQLSFIGKDYAKKQAGEKPTTVVVPDNEHNQEEINKNSKNLFFTGDNLEILRHLQNNYRNSIDVIYIDPPYNTGNDGFVYPDNFEYSDEVLQDIFGLNESELSKLKSIQGKSTHSAWLTFMYPRISLAKQLLIEDGVIFASIDENEYVNFKLIFDEVFGEVSFIENIVWNKKSSAKGVPSTTMMAGIHEYIIAFQRGREYKFIGEKRTVNDGFKNPDNDPRGPWRESNIRSTTLSTDKAFTIKNPETGKEYRNTWAFSEVSLNRMIQEGRILWKENLPKQKEYLHEMKNENKAIRSNFGVFDAQSNTVYLKKLMGHEKIFSNPKPIELIKYLILVATDTNALILDFFAGSATTADAVIQLNAEDGGNRKYIMVQLDESTYEIKNGEKVARKGSEPAFNAGYMSIDEISRERIKRASQKICNEKRLTLPENFDGGFKHYRVVKPTQASINDLETYDPNTGMFVDSKGMQVAFSESGFDDMIQPFSSEGLGVSGGATGVDTIITTWMIQDGYKLDNEVHQLEIDSYNVFYVEPTRIYLIDNNWNSNNTKILLNKIGNYDLNVQTVVIYAYSFSLESIRELELGLKQLPNKVNLVKRY